MTTKTPTTASALDEHGMSDEDWKELSDFIAHGGQPPKKRRRQSAQERRERENERRAAHNLVDAVDPEFDLEKFVEERDAMARFLGEDPRSIPLPMTDEILALQQSKSSAEPADQPGAISAAPVGTPTSPELQAIQQLRREMHEQFTRVLLMLKQVCGNADG